MNIHLVTGATGFLGRHLVTMLLRDNQRVWVIARPDEGVSAANRIQALFATPLRTSKGSIHTIEGDVLQKNAGLSPKDIAYLKKNTVTVWHLAANLSFLSTDKDKVWNANYNGTRTMVQLANDIAQDFFYVSTAYVCGTIHEMTENDLDKGQQFHNEYERSKFHAEKYVRKHTTLPYLIFRPSIIVGDAHKGKANGCTFGYYRYMYVFHFFKEQIIKAARKQTLIGRYLRTTKTVYTEKSSTLSAPGLILPYPRHAAIDIIPVDYVASSMISLSQSNVRQTAIHLTQTHLPEFKFLFTTALHDLGYRNIKYIPVPAWMFRALLRVLYTFAVPVRKYIRSVMWYTPYITNTKTFDRSAANDIISDAPKITRTLIKKINHHAIDDLLNDMSVE